SLNIRDFYPLIHPKLRDFLVENKTPESTVHLFSLINSNLNKLPATLTEIVFIFDCLSEGPDLTPAWTFFSKHKETILHGDRKKIVLGLTLDSILYKAGRVALTLGYDIEARALFSQMSSGASERDAALQEILHYDTGSFAVPTVLTITIVPH
ncbi:MAG: hypothetical protein NTV34_00980, partial [Proteobacteria bacterium]|nr:hypothetical protein [Pseudomonadota bacterium]